MTNNNSTSETGFGIEPSELPTGLDPEIAQYLSNEFAKYYKNLEDYLRRLAMERHAMESRLDLAEDRMRENNNKSIESLSIFVALFTFISVEFALFKEVNDFAVVVALTFILAGMLSLFILLLNLVMRSNDDKRTKGWHFGDALLLIIIVGLIGSGLWFFESQAGKYLIKDADYVQPSPSPSTTPLPSPK